MANFTAGTSFSDGVTNDVTAAKLNALVADAVPTSNLSLNSTTGTIGLFSSGTGTAATPAIQPTGDTNTGIFFPAADTIAFAEGGAEAMRIDSSGNVGIKNSTPSSYNAAATDLVIGSGSSNSGITIAASTTGLGSIHFADGTSGDTAYRGIIKYEHTTDNLQLFTAATERLRIDSSGNVGIGTGGTAAADKLDVYGTAYFHGIELGKGGQTGNRNVIIDMTGDDTYTDYGFRIIRQNTGANASTVLQARGTGGLFLKTEEAGDIVLQTTNTERVRIDSSGGVTIAGLAGSGSRAVNASAAGLLSAASDASLKEEVVGAHIAGLNEILQIHPKMYRWKDDIANRGDEASVELGFIANDVAPIIPSAAPLGNDGLYGFYDRSITAALVKAIQELKAKNDSLEARLQALEAK